MIAKSVTNIDVAHYRFRLYTSVRLVGQLDSNSL